MEKRLKKAYVGVALFSVFLSPPLFASERVINGSTVSSSDSKWSFIVSLQMKSNGSYAHMCGGSLIDDEWVLTAAHCVTSDRGSVYPASYFRVGSGSYSLNSINPVSVKKIIRHPRYSSWTLNNDIALVQLSSSISGISPVALDYSSPLSAGTEAWSAGWGNTSINDDAYPSALQEAYLPIVEYNTCNKAYDYSLYTSMVCAGYMDGSKDTCSGDSGGPLLVSGGSGYKLAGIVSFGGSDGQACAASGYPGVYTKVQSFTSWIESYTGTLSQSTASSIHASSSSQSSSSLSSSSFNIPVYRGWNLIGNPSSSTLDVSTLPYYKSAYSYDNGYWDVKSKFNACEGFWFYSSYGSSISVKSSPCTLDLDLMKEGVWYMVTTGESIPLSKFSSFSGVWKYANGRWITKSGISSLEPGVGYWILK